MSLYLSPRSVGGTVAIAVCERCGMKKYRGELEKDPNNGLSVCSACKDDFDPWRKPARPTENIAVKGGPLKDEDLV